MNDEIRRLADAGDWDGYQRAVKAERRRAHADTLAAAQARRESPDRQVRALQAARDGDPDWRQLMPLRWRAGRHWSIYWPAHLSAALYLTCIVLLAWLTA